MLQRCVRAFPNLKSLDLNENLLGETMDGLSDVAVDQTPRFLTVLNLSRNKIATWAQLGAVAGYALLELRMQHNPITEGDTALTSWQVLRQVAIAVMPTILRFNSGEVNASERKQSEIHFLRAHARDGSPVVAGLRETCDVDAHLARIRASYDINEGPSEGDTVKLGSTLADCIVEVRLQPVGTAIMEMPELKKKLPGTMTVGDLKRLCCKLFKQKIPLDRLTLTMGDGIIHFPLDTDHWDLSFYGICEGQVIKIDDAQDSSFEKGAKQVEALASSLEDHDADDI